MSDPINLSIGTDNALPLTIETDPSMDLSTPVINQIIEAISPTVTAERTADGVTLTIEDKNGEQTVELYDGADGNDGQDGADGVSPAVSVESIVGGHEVTITDADGDHTFNVMDGADGQDGQDGQDGETPERGVDYWTEEDQEAIIADVKDAIIDDTAGTGDTTVTWSADKLVSELADKADVSDIPDISGLYTKPSGGIPSTDLADSYIEEPASEGTSGQVLTTDGNGGRSWSTIQSGLVVPTFTYSNNSWSCDMTFAQVKSAVQADTCTSCLVINEFGDEETYYLWVCESSYVNFGIVKQLDQGQTLYGKLSYSSSSITVETGTGIFTGNLATDYTSLSFPVSKDTLCIHDGRMYKAKADISTSESWTSAHWDRVKVADELSLLSGAIQEKYTKPSSGIPASDIASGVIPDVSGFYTKPSGGIPSADLAETYIEEPSSDGTSGQVLTTDGNGGRTWTTVQGGSGTTNYNDLSNKPQIGGTTLSGDKSLSDLGIAAASAIPDVTGKADKVSSATSGNFAALDANGNLTDSGHKHSDYLTSHQSISGKADKVSNAINGNFAGLDGNGNLTDSGKKSSDFGTYSKPSGGIPSSDLASAVQTSLGKADTAYQKPSGGIPSTDMTSAVQTSLGKADTAYQKPSGGIPGTDLASGVIPSVPTAYTSNPAGLGTASPGSSTSWARGDHVHAMPTAANVGAIAAPSSPATGAFLVYNGSAWVAQTLSTWQGGSY